MQKLLNDCLPWFTWKAAVVLGGVFLGFVLYAVRASWSGWLSATPLLAIALCVLPCLLPSAFLWRKGEKQDAELT